MADLENLKSFCAALKSDDGWSDLLKEDLLTMSDAEGMAWLEYCRHASQVLPELPDTDWEIDKHVTEEGGNAYEEEVDVDGNFSLEAAYRRRSERILKLVPNSAWSARTKELVISLGKSEFRRCVLRWLDQVPKSRTGFLLRPSVNRELLRGIVWSCREIEDEEIASALGITCRFFFLKNSPLATNVVTVLALRRDEFILSLLGVIHGKLKPLSQRVLLQVAREKFALASGIPIDELEDRSIPDFGLQEIGIRREKWSGYGVELRIDATRVHMEWAKPDGTPLKSIPAAVKRDHAEELAELIRSKKEIQETLTRTARRMEQAPIKRRSWPLETWRANLCDHPVAGTVIRRLIWIFEVDGKQISGIHDGSGLSKANGEPINLSEKTKVSLWHSIDQSVEEIRAWRERLESLRITQPFKQAHREVYLLTYAERATETYSNRFASHILRQSQLRALSKERGWNCDFIANIEGGVNQVVFPEWGILGLLTIHLAGRENPHAGASASYVSTHGTIFIRLGTQAGGGLGVRFPLAEIPPLVFSEVMRDIDLFVGVCSVGNDPTWTPDGRGELDAYWRTYTQGELANTAKTRKEVLERLIPRLNIADRCTFAERFLVVKGSKRTYKIHLGSGNILMEPNDQYLCIVPDSKSRVAQGDLYLPFEGDNMLSIILSKALLLAEDGKIKDSTIVRQIEGV